MLHSTIQELSEELFASKSAIHRFCCKLGFQGYRFEAGSCQNSRRMEKDELINVTIHFKWRTAQKLLCSW
ncbi:MAG: hypothetical protein ACLT16_10550 [[Clostridium] innocuum]